MSENEVKVSEEVKDLVELLDVERLQIENIVLKHDKLQQQIAQLKMQLDIVGAKIKKRAEIPEEANLQIDPGDLRTVKVSFSESE